MSYQGYIYLHRKLQNNFLWDSKEKFDKRSAWIDMIFSANHADKEIMFDSQVMIIRRGQFLTSQSKLAQKWGWNRKTVKKYLDTLQQAGMISYDTTERSTLITIQKYVIYQDYKAFGRQQDGQLKAQQDGQLRDRSMDSLGTAEWAQTINIINDNKCIRNENEIIPAPPCEGGEWQ